MVLQLTQMVHKPWSN